jgi:hypothetical protein
LKKLSLEVEPDIDFLLVGMVIDERISRLAWLLNTHCEANFFRTENLELPDFNPVAETEFARMEYEDEVNHLQFTLLANKSEHHFLAPDLARFDYLLVIRGGIDMFDLNEYFSKIRQITELRLVAAIEQIKLKQKLSWIL